MNIELRTLDSSMKHIKGNEKILDRDLEKLEVLKEEKFAFQILIKASEPLFCNMGNSNEIHWKGLGDRIRIQMVEYEELFNLSFLGYVNDDMERLIGDPILKKKSLYIDEEYQMIWVEGKIPKDFKDKEIKLKIDLFYTKGYEKERLLQTITLDINIIDYVLKPLQEGEFHLDLWQHFTNWGRAYDVEHCSDEHFQIVENYIEELAKLGNRVITLIVTDYPWAGQRCYEVMDNPSNLYEFNMVKVSKDREGKINCDFTSLDRYIDICFKHGIKDEINIFGILGNWDAYAFGNPISGYKDPLRIQYYNHIDKTYDYMKTTDELKEYLILVFKHLVDRGIWDIVKIISDEPNNVSVFKECVDFLNSCLPDHKINYKCSLHHQEFFEKYGENIQDLSLNTCELVNNIDVLPQIKEQVESKGGKLTWFSCCFPEDLNIFLKSHLIESRLKGWFTYYWNCDGFLRWSYAIWPRDPFLDTRYKYPKWNAGDMFFVYPGKDLKPMNSVRLENFVFGIQDFNIFKKIEKKGISKEELIEKMERVLGSKDEMKFIPERNIEMNYSLDYNDYIEFKNNLVKKYLV